MNLPIRKRKIKIAIVGCGRISQKHFEAIKKHNKDIKLVAICDNNPSVLKQTIKQLNNVSAYANLESMLNQESPDIITLCTPSGLHAKQTIEIARVGIHVISEKPMATRWIDGVSMVNICDTNKVRLFVVKQNRRNTTLQLLKRAFEEKRFGRIFMVNINVFWMRPQQYYDQAEWRGTWDLDGGAFMNQASHYVDLIDWLIGPVDCVQAMTGTLDRNIEVEDSGVLNIKWRNGALGSMNVTMLTYPKNLEGSITILGEKGTVKIGGIAVNEIQHWEFEDVKDYDQEIENIYSSLIICAIKFDAWPFPYKSILKLHS